MKYIYLDQNKWIELAKGLKNKEQKYISLYDTILKNVKDGIWAFPISIIHITETMKRKNETSRKELLDLMFAISNGYAICDYTTADNIEFNHWVNSNSLDCSQTKGLIIKRDLVSVLGLSTENVTIKCNGIAIPSELEKIAQIIKNHSCDREVFDLICEIISNEGSNGDEDYFYECYRKGRDDFQLWKKTIEKTEEYKSEHLYPAYLIRTFFQIYEEKLTSLSQNARKNIVKIFEECSTNKTNTINILETLPGFNVFNRLVFELYNNPDKQVHKHDFNDLAYMRVAVPYCDIVIGENYWCDRVKHYHLDKKYNTIVSTSLMSLIDKG